MGHEFTGVVHAVGSAVSSVKLGDRVICPFTTSCANTCFYCRRGQSSRCSDSLPLGSTRVDGAQAEYVRVPSADSTLVRQPLDLIRKKFPNYTETEIKKESQKFVLMADIFPTGFFAARNALKDLTGTNNNEFNNLSKTEPPVIAVIGCGPVGLCGIISITHLAPKGSIIYAIDTVPDRLNEAQKLGAIPIRLDPSKPLADDPNGPLHVIQKATNGRGADAIMEIVGRPDALRLAFELVRPFGRISSVGVHNAEIPIAGNEAYDKNVTMQFGRCPVRSIFNDALPVFVQNLDKLDIMTGHIMNLKDAVEAYEIFEKRKVQKIVFKI